MFENIIAWAGLGLLFILCLPLAGVQRRLLALYGLGLRVGMLALVGAAAYLWFVPTQLPTEIADTVRNTPSWKSILPDPGAPIFAICAVSLIAAAVLPLIAIISICRRTVGRREKITASEPVQVRAALVLPDGRPPQSTQPQDPLPPRFGRRAAANAMAQAGSSR